jgi:tripartite-type tricarboxylate transporter receptor subunit TctC
MRLNVLLRRSLPYRLEDFARVALLLDGPLSLTINAALPPRDTAGFVAYAKASPNPLRHATNGIGCISHLFGMLTAQAMGIDLVDVVYRGSGPSTADLLAGVIEISVEAPTTTLEHIRAGKLRLLGLSFAERASLFPEVPTFKEAGYPDLGGGLLDRLALPRRHPARAGGAAECGCQPGQWRAHRSGSGRPARRLRAISGPPDQLHARWTRHEAVARDHQGKGRSPSTSA